MVFVNKSLVGCQCSTSTFFSVSCPVFQFDQLNNPVIFDHSSFPVMFFHSNIILVVTTARIDSLMNAIVADFVNPITFHFCLFVCLCIPPGVPF